MGIPSILFKNHPMTFCALQTHPANMINTGYYFFWGPFCALKRKSHAECDWDIGLTLLYSVGFKLIRQQETFMVLPSPSAYHFLFLIFLKWNPKLSYTNNNVQTRVYAIYYFCFDNKAARLLFSGSLCTALQPLDQSYQTCTLIPGFRPVVCQALATTNLPGKDIRTNISR